MQDILYKTDTSVFSYRVGGLLYRNGKVLLQKPRDDDHAVIGGHVLFSETSMEALKREFMEELHVEIIVKELAAVGEIFFPWGNKPCHQICFYYRIELSEPDALSDDLYFGFDELDDKHTELLYKWVPLEEIRNGLKVYPLELIPHILSLPQETVHFISKES